MGVHTHAVRPHWRWLRYRLSEERMQILPGPCSSSDFDEDDLRAFAGPRWLRAGQKRKRNLMRLLDRYGL
ncbi:hypothetical protein [Streptomyces sp. NPDC051677]|uniref:hypothetical protein n=1 Tax=Streptomyces sp. NPDC051677 TaxID=3365669 RepID=UPI0037D12F69